MTLGISTNTRLLGLVIIDNGYLRDYKIHHHKQPWSPAKVTQIIASLEPCVRRYSLKNVVLSIPHEYHQTKAWKILASAIESYFVKEALPIYPKKVKEIYSLCPSEEKRTKKALMLTLTELYPELSYCYYKETRNKNKYYIKLFEAVAVAVLQEQV